MDHEQTLKMPYKKSILFQKWIADPFVDNHNRFRQFRDEVTKWIRNTEKKE